MEGGGGGQEEDQVHRHEQRNWEVEVEAVRGGLDEALAVTKSDKVFLLNKFIEILKVMTTSILDSLMLSLDVHI